MRAYLLPLLVALSIVTDGYAQPLRKYINHTRIELRNFSPEVFKFLDLDKTKPCVLDSYVVSGAQGQEVSYFDLLCDRKADGAIWFRNANRKSVISRSTYIDDPSVPLGYKRFIEGAVTPFSGQGFSENVPRNSKEAEQIQHDFNRMLEEMKRQRQR